MATLRVHVLAKELGVTSKAVLDKCKAEGIDTLKNPQSAVSAGLEATIREWFAEGGPKNAVETTEHVDLAVEHEKAKKQRRKGKKGEVVEAAAEEAPAAPEAEAPPVPAPAPEEPGAVEVSAPVAVPVAAPLPVEVPPAAGSAPAPETEVIVPATPGAAAPAEPPAVAASAPAAAPVTPAAPTTPPAPVQPPKPAIKPAGPQLIPRPARLQGPRVVRVEKPDFVRTPRRRPPSTAAPAAAPLTPTVGPAKKGRKPTIAEEAEEEGKGAAKKRSPRRRGGRSADSGEGITEWRNQDLLERTERISAAGGSLRRHRLTSGKGHEGEAHVAIPAAVEVEEPISVKSMSAAAGIKSGEIIRKLMDLGTMATINQIIDRDTAQTIAAEFGIELKIRRAQNAEEELATRLAERAAGERETRAPVVTFLGHVDHGKTSLLDRIRSATVASGEAGGITQHIGAYRYDVGGSHVVFLDTPGHEAFTAMRARGANMTDVVVLVVAADDGVMPQTVEALSHAKAAKVPIVVALNKIDLPNANEQRVMGQLAEQGLQPREWGGNVEVIRTSASTGQGIDTLVETLSLEAELLELKAEPAAPASGFVIEAKMDPGLGVVARLLVRDGTLKLGDILLAGRGFGRIRQMVDSAGKPVEVAGPSTPLEVSGLDEMPEAGDRFYVVETIDEAREVAEDRRQRARSAGLATVPQRTLEGMLQRIEAGQATSLDLIIKADVQGSIEAITGSIAKLNTAEVRVNVLHAAVGGITTGDVSLAEASDAIIIGFNAVPDSAARQMADAKGVDIRQYRIIYDILEDIRKALEEGLAPEIKLETLGRAEIRQTFKVSKVGTVAGCYVTEGVAQRNAKVRLVRNNIVVEDERTLESLKRFKDDAREVKAGLECGLKIAGYDDIKEGDVLEFYQKISVSRKLG